MDLDDKKTPHDHHLSTKFTTFIVGSIYQVLCIPGVFVQLEGLHPGKGLYICGLMILILIIFQVFTKMRENLMLMSIVKK